MEFLRRHVTYSKVVASVALFVALGGSSSAANTDSDDVSGRALTSQTPGEPTVPTIPTVPTEAGVEVPLGDRSPVPTRVGPYVQRSGSGASEPTDAGAASAPSAEPPAADVASPPSTESREASKREPGGADRGRRRKRTDKGTDGERGGGPPPWAPAHGYRCREAGNRPGSDAFKRCVKTGGS